MRGLLIGTATAPTSMLGRAWSLHPQVAIRPEPFGALAYHFDTRRLVFLKHPDVVRVVEAVDHHDSVADALEACAIDPERWPAFELALGQLARSEMLVERTATG